MVASHPTPLASTPTPSTPSASAPALFLIDDDPIFGRTLANYLNARWFRDAQTALEALATLAEADTNSTANSEANPTTAQLPHAIILDLILDGMGGISLLNELQSDSRLSQIPVIILSSFPPPDLGPAYGVIATLDKSTTTPSEIRHIVNRQKDQNHAPVFLTQLRKEETLVSYGIL
ncbi:response regulator [Candidatus Saccharibacteria bacterium]|nr:response regulator [Candidatus Saccharibacteria bacterium]